MATLNPLRRAKASALVKLTKLTWGLLSKADVKLIVVGAQKAGTTALYHYLSEHPEIQIPEKKEINYFNALGEDSVIISNYQKNFPSSFKPNKRIISVDISPSYLLDAQVTAKKIHSMSPTKKIVVVLREPVSRAVSSWFMYKKLFAKNPDWFIESPWVKDNFTKKIVHRKKPFGEDFMADLEEEIIALDHGQRIEYPIIEYGLYKQQLEPFISLFGRDNILIISNECLKNKTQNSLNRITSFIGLKEHTLDKSQLTPHFVGDNKHEISESCIKLLSEYYCMHNQGLNRMVGDEFNWASM